MSTISDRRNATTQAEHGLCHYIHTVATELHTSPEATYCESADEASAYIALESRLPDKPHRELALIWDERHGWALALETSCGEDLLILSWYGPPLLPHPDNVAHFVHHTLASHGSGTKPPICTRAPSHRARRSDRADQPAP